VRGRRPAPGPRGVGGLRHGHPRGAVRPRDRLKNSRISKVVITDTLPLDQDRRIDKIEVLSVAGIIADAIDAVFEDLSVSDIFGGDNLS
jgi:phosphoribosylpyrophosphate synthetase